MWECQNRGKKHQDSFDACWNCGTSRAGEAPADFQAESDASLGERNSGASVMYKLIGRDGKEYGPVTADQLRLWISEGRAHAEYLVQLEGTAEWKTVADFPELQAAVRACSVARELFGSGQRSGKGCRDSLPRIDRPQGHCGGVPGTFLAASGERRPGKAATGQIRWSPPGSSDSFDPVVTEARSSRHGPGPTQERHRASPTGFPWLRPARRTRHRTP